MKTDKRLANNLMPTMAFSSRLFYFVTRLNVAPLAPNGSKDRALSRSRAETATPNADGLKQELLRKKREREEQEESRGAPSADLDLRARRR
jgi:hypothetical protein